MGKDRNEELPFCSNEWSLLEIPDAIKWFVLGVFANTLSRERNIHLSWNFQDIIRTLRSVFLGKTSASWKFSKMIVTRKWRRNGTNPSRLFTYPMSKTWVAKRRYQMEKFPRWIHWKYKEPNSSAISTHRYVKLIVLLYHYEFHLKNEP